MKYIKQAFIFLIALVVWSSFSQNSPPNISISESQTYCNNSDTPIVSNVSITDADAGDDTLNEVNIQISEGYQIGLDLLIYTGNNPNLNSTWSAPQGKLTLTGPATLTEFEVAILEVVFSSTETNFTSNKSISVNLGNANYLPSTSHYYFYVSDVGITWQDAKVAAANQTYFGLQGYLATITSQEEVQLTGEQSSGTGWIGGSDQQQEGTWIWETGPEQGQVFWIGEINGFAPNGAFAFWNIGEPNQLGEEDYAHITDPSIGTPGSWNDLTNTGPPSGVYQPKGYVVEFGGLPGDPEVNLSASTTLIMPQITISDVQTCQNEEITISITSNADVVNWYESQTSTNVLNSGLSYTLSFENSTFLWIEPDFNVCSGIAERLPIFIDVIPTPINNSITITECSSSNSIETAGFNLDSFVDLIIEPDAVNTETNLNVSFFKDSDLSTLITENIYTNTLNFESIYAQILNTVTGCSSVAEITLEVVYNDLGELSISKCDEVDNDGFSEFILSEADEFFLSGNPDDLSINYYETLQDALAQTNALPDSFQNTIAESQTIYTRLNAIEGCFGLGRLELNVNTIPIPNEIDDVYYCLNTFPEPITLLSGIDEDDLEDYSYLWSNGETSSSIQINTIGEYSVEITDVRGCSITNFMSVLSSDIPEILSVDVTDFTQNNAISINASSTNGNLNEYSIDGINYQTSNTFTNLTEYEYLIHVRDANGCGEVIQRVFLLDYPEFFTPNGDGINDFWQIINSKEEIFLKLFIYDRYGKLIADILPTGPGWDGSYLSKPMPSNDYWFSVLREDGKEFRGNFTLKR